MILESFSPDRHPLEEVAALVYDTDPLYFSLVFGRSRAEAVRRIQEVICGGGSAFGRENITCAVRDGRVVGIRILLAPDAPGIAEEFFAIARAAGLATALRFLIAEWLLFAPHYLERHAEYHITNLSVVPAERGRGVGAALLDDAIRRVRPEGGGRILLNVIEPNPAAVQLYAKKGFRTLSRHRAWVPFRMLCIRTMVYDAGPDRAAGGG